jgi:hypothetical protein
MVSSTPRSAIAHPGIHIVNQVFAPTDAGRLGTTAAEVAASDRVPIAQIGALQYERRLGVRCGAGVVDTGAWLVTTFSTSWRSLATA